MSNMLRGTMDRMRDSKVIDRQLVNSLMVTYVAKPSQRDDVLSVMSKILEWDEATKEAVGIREREGTEERERGEGERVEGKGEG